MPLTAAQRQQAAQDELIAYLEDNPQATYRDAHSAVSRDAIRQYRRLKQAGRIASNVAIVDGQVEHTIKLVVNDAN
jgi:hypothetical protein